MMRRFRSAVALAACALASPSLCAAQSAARDEPVTLAGVALVEGQPRASAALVRCSWPGRPATTRLLFAGERACGRFELLRVDAFETTLRDVQTGREFALTLPAGTRGVNSQPAPEAVVAPTAPMSAAGAAVTVRRDDGQTRITLTRAALEAYAADVSGLLASAEFRPRPLPAGTSGLSGVDGFELRAIRDGSILSALGLVDGDVLLELNGARLRDPMGAVAALAALRSNGHATVGVLRGPAFHLFVVDIER